MRNSFNPKHFQQIFKQKQFEYNSHSLKMNTKLILLFAVVLVVAIVASTEAGDKYHVKKCDKSCDYSKRIIGSGGGAQCESCCREKGFKKGSCGGWTGKTCNCKN